MPLRGETLTCVCLSQGKPQGQLRYQGHADLYKLASLHAHFKKKVKSNILELEDEQDQIDQQQLYFQRVHTHDQMCLQHTTLRTQSHDAICAPTQVQERNASFAHGTRERTAVDSHKNMIFILMDETLLLLSMCSEVIAEVIIFLKHCYQHRELKSRWRLALLAQVFTLCFMTSL